MPPYLHDISKRSAKAFRISIKRILIAIVIGIILGFVGAAFYWCMNLATDFRTGHWWMIFFLPVCGLLIIWLYRIRHVNEDGGTNLVIESVCTKEKLPLQMAPLIFITTVLTHLCGGSAGREGAALQIGGSISTGIGRLFRVKEDEQDILTMCGMSAAFSAIFGTPLTAAIFALEVAHVGIMQYAALVPCVISALTAHGIVSLFFEQDMGLSVISIPSFNIENAIIFAVFGALCAAVSIAFCILLHKTQDLYRKHIRNIFLRIFLGGCFVLALTLIFRSQDYNGLGLSMIQTAFRGDAPPYAFVFKMILTALTLGAGYKGGEIVPTFFVGATFGCLFANLFGLSPSLCAAAGMGALFCGVTNCPITALLLCFELFGFDGMPFYLLTIAISFLFSGYFGLYRTQRIVYSKYKTDYINKKAE